LGSVGLLFVVNSSIHDEIPEFQQWILSSRENDLYFGAKIPEIAINISDIKHKD
jgi:hypothetical protein